jgi:sec-independent protein translocase protein TatA
MSPPAAELATISTQPDRLIGCFEALEPVRPHEALPSPLRMGCAQSRARQPRGGRKSSPQRLCRTWPPRQLQKTGLVKCYARRTWPDPQPPQPEELTSTSVLGDIIQPTHLLFILVIALLVLGPKRLPEVARSLGRGIRDFRDAVSSHTSDAHELRDMVFGEESLGGTATAGTHPVATTTSTADTEEPGAPTMTARATASTATRPAPSANEQPAADQIYGD